MTRRASEWLLVGASFMGCQSTSTLPDATDLDHLTCSGMLAGLPPVWSAAGGIAPSPPADFVALKVVDRREDTPSYSVQGELCPSSTSQAACDAVEAGLEAHDQVLVLRRGDEVEVHATRRAIVSALLPIDTPDEAVLAAVLSGDDSNYLLPVYCGEGLGAMEVDDGFDVVLVGDEECRPTGHGSEQQVTSYRHLIRVTPAGEARELARERGDIGYCEDFCTCT